MPKIKSRTIIIKEHILLKRLYVAIIVYFRIHKNQSATYREIARAYKKTCYTHYKKICQEMVKKHYLIKYRKKYRLSKLGLNYISGKEVIERSLPYFEYYKKRIKRK